ncbi:hypothetical protein GCM10009037_28310 [Halarchaeum grantii]|uniref:Exonuclease RecJ n=1 Tax=Halarchaeum grantii TaxID=1193105 RepID=A0A830FD84_9EURY|nr:hypothetical protein [Halarchaeum grantii]GGL43178.1 hypothetical protein GCM10009037_28310 [Halarchaeum grantii]
MSTTGRSGSSADAATLTDCLREGAFVRVVARAGGDALAAAGLLGRACSATNTPYQVSVAATRSDASARLDGLADSDAGVAVGFDGLGDASLSGGVLSETALDAARALDESPSAALALAGVRAADEAPSGALADLVARRPGVGLPVADLSDGLAHTTLCHAPWSGDDRRTGALLAELELPAELEADSHRRLASRVALDATEDAAPDAVDALARVLRPHVLPDGPFETAEGYGDVLDCLAYSRPGLATALALGVADRADALDAWREHATATHNALRANDPARYSGVVVCEVDAPAWPLARLVRDGRSPESLALVVGESGAALASTSDGPDASAVLAAAVGDGAVSGSATRALTTETDTEALREGVQGALST